MFRASEQSREESAALLLPLFAFLRGPLFRAFCRVYSTPRCLLPRQFDVLLNLFNHLVLGRFRALGHASPARLRVLYPLGYFVRDCSSCIGHLSSTLAQLLSNFILDSVYACHRDIFNVYLDLLYFVLSNFHAVDRIHHLLLDPFRSIRHFLSANFTGIRRLSSDRVFAVLENSDRLLLSIPRFRRSLVPRRVRFFRFPFHRFSRAISALADRLLHLLRSLVRGVLRPLEQSGQEAAALLFNLSTFLRAFVTRIRRFRRRVLYSFPRVQRRAPRRILQDLGGGTRRLLRRPALFPGPASRRPRQFWTLELPEDPSSSSVLVHGLRGHLDDGRCPVGRRHPFADLPRPFAVHALRHSPRILQKFCRQLPRLLVPAVERRFLRRALLPRRTPLLALQLRALEHAEESATLLLTTLFLLLLLHPFLRGV